MSTEPRKFDNMSGDDFYSLLRETYLVGSQKIREKEKAEDLRAKNDILNAIIEAASYGKTSIRLLLNAPLSKSNEKFLKSAHIEWENCSSTLGGILTPQSSAAEYIFYWEHLSNELVFEEDE